MADAADPGEVPDGGYSHESKGKSSVDDVKQPLVDSHGDDDPEKGGGAEAASSSTVFNRGERPMQDVLFAKIFLGCTAILLVREVFIFFWPVLGLRFFDASTFSVMPFIAILVGVALTVPGCFALLWATRLLKGPAVKACLVLCLAFFVISLGASVVHQDTTSPGSEELEPPFEGPAEGQSNRDTLPSLGSHPAGALGDPSESSMLEAAIPGSISRILRATEALSAPPSRIRSVALPRMKSPKGPMIYVARRILRFTNLVQQNRLVFAETILNDLLNAAGVLLLLYYCESLFSLVAVIISDSSKFVLTRGRGLVFVVIALTAAGVLISFPAVSTGLQVAKACKAEHSPGGEITTAGDIELCRKWTSAIFADPLGSLFTFLGLFLGVWFAIQIQFGLQFVAAHVVGQFYGNTQASLEEDDVQPVLRACKCAFFESSGSLSLLSLVYVAGLASSFLFNLGIMFIMGSSVFAAVPLFINSLAFFVVGTLLSSFVLPIMALSGQSVLDATYSAIALVHRNLVSAVAVTLSALCVVGVFIFLIIFVSFIVGMLAAAIFAVAGGIQGLQFMLLFIILAVLLLGTSVGSLTLFHWVFSTTISTTYVCMAMEGKANEATETTPLALPE